MKPTDRHSPGHEHVRGRQNPEVTHEDSDIDVATVLRFGAGLFITVVVCAVIVWGVFRLLERQAAARDPQLSPLVRPAGQLPPAPRLETNERALLANYRAEQTKVLEGYGWVDQQAGVAHIPVAEAKKLIVQRGLPVRAEAQVNPWQGTRAHAYGEASGGRTIPGAPPTAATPPATEPAAPPAPVRK